MQTSVKHVRGESEPWHIGAVSFFNTRPLIFGLEELPNVLLERKVPAHLALGLDSGRLDTALVPSIDYQRPQSDWAILPVGAIASSGEVLTVRVFSRKPIEQIQEIACDTDSHTSVVLAQVLWQLRYQRPVRIHPLQGSMPASAMLLIGDKVLGHLGHWPYELDLGAAWTELTHLPFVYAFWAVRIGIRMDGLADILTHARHEGTSHIDEIVLRHAAEHGFEPQQARRYFQENLHFDFGSEERQGLTRFYELAYQLGFTQCLQPLRIYGESGREQAPPRDDTP